MSVTKTALTTAGKVSLFGWLENLGFWKALPYPVKGALLRGLKAGLSVLVAALLTAATAGTLFPVAWGPSVILILTMALQAADKFIREWNIDTENKEDNSGIPTSDTIPEGDDAVNLPPVNTDATVPPKETPVEPPVVGEEPIEEVVLDDTNDPVVEDTGDELPDST